jgi:hypothetical protein
MLASDKRYLSRFALDPETDDSLDDLSGFAISNLFNEEVDQLVDEDIFDNKEITAQEDRLVEKKP